MTPEKKIFGVREDPDLNAGFDSYFLCNPAVTA